MDGVAERDFRQYVAARHAALYRTAVLLTGHREDAEDLLQIALARLALRWTTVARHGTPDAYVRKIMYHQHISRWRRHRAGREYVTAMVPEVASPGDHATETTTRIALANALGELTPKQRAVIVLRYYEDLPESEIAALLGCGVGTVRSQIHRTLARMRTRCPELSPLREMA